MLIIECGSKEGSSGDGAAAAIDTDNTNAESGVDNRYDVVRE